MFWVVQRMISAHDANIVEAGASNPPTVEKLAAVQDQGVAHFPREVFPRQVAVLRPLGDQHECVGAFGYLHWIVTENDFGIGVFSAGSRESDGIVGSDLGAAFGEFPGR